MSKRTGASRQSPSPMGGRTKAYFAGLASGLFVAFLVNLLDIGPAQLMNRNAGNHVNSGAEKAGDKSAAKSAATQTGTKFDFYTVLPEQEVVVADDTAGAPGVAATAAAVAAQPTTVPPPAIAEKVIEGKSAPITDLSQPAENVEAIKKLAAAEKAKTVSAIYLQAGSFRRIADADKRRAELLMYGMRASAEPVNSSGETWYRVQIGPFASDAEMSRARSKLKANGIDTLMTRRK